MEKSAPKSPRLHGIKLNTLAASFDANQALADALRGLKAKLLAMRARTSPRTAENWLQATNGPTWKHNVAMLQDDLLAPVLLKAAGREDLADPEKAILGLARQVIAKHGPDHPVLQRPDVRAVLEAAAAK